MVHGAAAIVLADRGLTNCCKVDFGYECFAMFTNRAAQPSIVGENGMVCAMLLWGRRSSSMISNNI
jgi:hypothetical protein